MGANWEIDGSDIVVRNTIASNFGDKADIDAGTDNGVGAWGFDYINHPDYLGCALPTGIKGATLPKLPPFTPVKIYSHETGRVIYAHMIDKGPSTGLNRGIDLLQASVHALGLTMQEGKYLVDYRIIGGAKFVTR